jgi:hypothetical protein
MTAWGKWITHNGQPVPHLAGQVVQTISEHPATGETYRTVTRPTDGQGGSWCWCKGCTRILRYRVAKPMGVLILEGILQRVRKDAVREIVRAEKEACNDRA